MGRKVRPIELFDLVSQNFTPFSIVCMSYNCWPWHTTFDFAQQACIPHHAREVGALYFKAPRQIQIFGVAQEAIPKQINFLVDENETIGPDSSKSHGPNSVLSMLHY